MTPILKNKKEIKIWLDTYGIQNYVINPDLSVDVNDNVDISDQKLTSIPVQFNQVNGDFDCSHNHLTSLEGCPITMSADFNGCRNNLVNLLGAPREVGGYFYCDHNQLISLEGAPKEVGKYFSCAHNCLQNFEFCPAHVKGDFYCNDNVLLGDLQLENKFSVIYREHLKYQLIKQEKENLSNLIHSSVKKSVGFKI